MNIINNNNIKIRNYILIIVSILINIFYQIKNNIFDLFYFQYSNITLKIKGIGYNTILGNETVGYNFKGINYLKEVYINGNIQNTKEYKYYFNQTDNYVELIWDDNINSCQYMFRKCSNITEINLSNFNTSQVTLMWSMFNGCSSLTSLDLSNFNTSQVTDMRWMFIGCSSLTSLDLSNFDTSQVTDMRGMFNGCTNLEYINLYNFKETKLNYADYMFDNVPENVVICINNKNSNGKISTQIRKKNVLL